VDIRQNISLKPYNTFGIAARARYFIEINSEDELREALSLKGYPPVFVLSGGSNVLLTGDLNALVLHINIKGIRLVREDDSHVVINVMAGENWHQLVLWTLEQDYGGLENLSLIPGNTGTAPIQNIGAYGVEIRDVFESCTAMEVNSGMLKAFLPAECHFGYRDSYFKKEGKGRYIITSVNLRLSRANHQLNTTYGAIKAELQAKGSANPGIRDVSEAVIAIRQSKLPDPKILGNSGSFFKNPVVSGPDYQRLAEEYPEAPVYRVSDNEWKVPAGWLIEQCGFKGKRFGDAGVHNRQALVLVNYGQATGRELLELARKIRDTVFQRFGVVIEPEVNIIGKEF
jgi:UDP-N-acetylmuramate dehydrogenase